MVTTNTDTDVIFVIVGAKMGEYEYNTFDVAQQRLRYWSALAPEDGPYHLVKRTITTVTVTHDEEVEL